MLQQTLFLTALILVAWALASPAFTAILPIKDTSDSRLNSYNLALRGNG